MRRPAAFAALAAAALLLAAPPAAGQALRLLDRTTAGAPGAGWCYSIDLSRDGEFAAFGSYDASLVPVDAIFNSNIFVVERSTGLITLESVSTAGVEADASCYEPRISGDGRFVVFVSRAATLVPGEAPPVAQAYLRDRLAKSTRRISLAADGGFVDADCTETAISDDGSFACFVSAATNVVAGLPIVAGHLYGVDVASGATELLTRASDGSILTSGGFDPAVDATGRCVAFTTWSKNHSDRDLNNDLDVLLRDRATGVTEWISDPGANRRFFARCDEPGISADGRFVALVNFNGAILANEPDTEIVCLRDRMLGVTTNEMPGAELRAHDTDTTTGPQPSDDGRFVTYLTSIQMVEIDGPWSADVHLRDRLLDRVDCVTVGRSGFAGSGQTWSPASSGDGRIVAFISQSSEFADDDDAPGTANAFLGEWPRDHASWTAYGAGFPGRDGAIPTMVPADPPHLGSTMALDFSNPSRSWSFAFVYAGHDAIDVPTSFGGRLLVAPIATLTVPLTPAGWRELVDLDYDWSLAGVVIRAQALELDPWAAKGVSFTAGMELVLGY